VWFGWGLDGEKRGGCFLLLGPRRSDERASIPPGRAMGVIRVSSRFQLLWNSCGGVRSSPQRIHNRSLVGVEESVKSRTQTRLKIALAQSHLNGLASVLS